jgi:hypothetical protein
VKKHHNRNRITAEEYQEQGLCDDDSLPFFEQAGGNWRETRIEKSTSNSREAALFPDE